VIWDEREVRSLDVTPEGLEEMVDAQTEAGQVGLDLVVSTRDDHAGLLMLYTWRTSRRGRPAAVCRTLEDALAQVGLTELPAELR
jgi:hypothetical protein